METLPDESGVAHTQIRIYANSSAQGGEKANRICIVDGISRQFRLVRSAWRLVSLNHIVYPQQSFGSVWVWRICHASSILRRNGLHSICSANDNSHKSVTKVWPSDILRLQALIIICFVRVRAAALFHRTWPHPLINILKLSDRYLYVHLAQLRIHSMYSEK